MIADEGLGRGDQGVLRVPCLCALHPPLQRWQRASVAPAGQHGPQVPRLLGRFDISGGFPKNLWFLVSVGLGR